MIGLVFTLGAIVPLVGGTLSSCNLSGEVVTRNSELMAMQGDWLEFRPGQSPDGEIDTFIEDMASHNFTVHNSPSKYWRNGTGHVNDDDTVDVYFPHNPWPHGDPVSLTGHMKGSCGGVYIYWDNDSIWCQKPKGSKTCAPAPWSAPNITTVHVVQSCHLDVGFADTAPGIVNRWFTHHFPMMIQVAEELRKDASTNITLQFMAQSYLISLYLDCPVGMDITCPTPSEVESLKEAIKRGDIYYHAFPFNAELELYDPMLIEEGIKLTHALDDQFGLKHKSTLSQRDVPGTTRSIIPILLKHGVNAITVGVNTVSSPPGVPKIFQWKDQGGEEITAMWHPRGYGGIGLEDAVIIDNCTHALVFDWNGDNAGPYDADGYKKQFASIQKTFPNAQVVSSTFDEFVEAISDFKTSLPVVTQEIGDTWIHGCPSDPMKVAKVRAVNRVWSKYLQSGGQRDAVFLNATRLALKGGEHTWGLDVKSNLQDNYDWSNELFYHAKQAGQHNASQFQKLEDSWDRQRNWSYDFAMQALNDAKHPLAQMLAEEWSKLSSSTPPNPTAEGFTKVSITQKFNCGQLSLAFGALGGLTTLTDASTGVEWASDTDPLFFGQYATYVQEDFVKFIKEYTGMTNIPDWALHDFGKPGLPDGQSGVVTTTLQALYHKQSAGVDSIYAKLAFPTAAVIINGAPDAMWVKYEIPNNSSNFSVTLTLQNKTLTRRPEALLFTVQPQGSKTANWEADKLGQWVDLLDVVDGGSKHIHGVTSGFRMRSPQGHTLVVGCIDAGIISAGAPTGFPTPVHSDPDMSLGVSSLLFDNLWGTNYVMWSMWHAEERTASSFRYTVALS